MEGSNPCVRGTSPSCRCRNNRKETAWALPRAAESGKARESLRFFQTGDCQDGMGCSLALRDRGTVQTTRSFSRASGSAAGTRERRISLQRQRATGERASAIPILMRSPVGRGLLQEQKANIRVVSGKRLDIRGRLVPLDPKDLTEVTGKQVRKQLRAKESVASAHHEQSHAVGILPHPAHGGPQLTV